MVSPGPQVPRASRWDVPCDNLPMKEGTFARLSAFVRIASMAIPKPANSILNRGDPVNESCSHRKLIVVCARVEVARVFRMKSRGRGLTLSDLTKTALQTPTRSVPASSIRVVRELDALECSERGERNPDSGIASPPRALAQ
jgi:hypothetical protein